MLKEFIPQSFLLFRFGYSIITFRKDLIAGITVGIIALPLAMAFAIASGVTPDRGLFTAIIAGFLISLLGGSRVIVGGPTGAFVVIIYGIVQKTGYEGLVMSTLIAALLLFLFGVFRMGSWIKYIPHPLIIGFTTGIAVLIFSSQIKDFFGLSLAEVPADFIEKWIAYYAVLPTMQLPTIALGSGTLILIILLHKFAPKIPWGIVSIVAATSVAAFFHLDVETIQSKFGGIPSRLPWPHLPSFYIPEGKLSEIFLGGIAIAFLGAIESLLCAVIADGMMGTRHKSNCELVGQGIANFASILFGGIPATGAIARTAANVKTGAETPVAGMIHAVVLLLIVVLFAPVVSQIPLTALAAVLFMVAWNMSEISHFFHLLKAPMADAMVLITAFLLTVFVDIVIAIFLGMGVACLLFMKKMSDFSKTVSLTKVFSEKRESDSLAFKKVPQNVEIYEIQGPFFFGAADVLEGILHNLEKAPKVFILRLRHVPLIDASGMNALKEFYHKCHHRKTVLLLAGVHGQTEKDLHRFGLYRLIGANHIFSSMDSALEKAEIICKA